MLLSIDTIYSPYLIAPGVVVTVCISPIRLELMEGRGENNLQLHGRDPPLPAHLSHPSHPAPTLQLRPIEKEISVFAE